jgi:putative ABC transport system substrate-binding protein
MSDCTGGAFRGIGGSKRTGMRTRVPLLLIAVLLALSAGFAGAQQRAKVPRIGIFGELENPSSRILESFRQGLNELGYVEQQNVILEPRFSSGQNSRYQHLAAELIGLQTDVIVAHTPPAIFAAMGATRTIPIVMTSLGDPISEGIVGSLERPGGNVTGVSGLVKELGGKWLELLKEAIPSAKRVVVLWNQPSEDKLKTWRAVELAARSLHVDLLWRDVGRGGVRDVESAFRPASFWGQADAFIVLPGGIFGLNRYKSEIIRLALRNRLPGIFWRGDFADEGGLMAYGVNRSEQSRRAAYFVDKILKGAKPADLPLERPTQFELVINLKTAKEIGVTINPEVLMFADRVIK